MDTDGMQDPLPDVECPQCGTPMHGIREAPDAGTEARAVFRCANGHTVVVDLVAEYDDDPANG